MKKGTCPKCGSRNVYSARDLPLKSGPFGSNCIPVSLLSMAPLDNYVCVDCGLVESHISDKYKLEEIARRWTPVNEAPEKSEKDDTPSE